MQTNCMLFEIIWFKQTFIWTGLVETDRTDIESLVLRNSKGKLPDLYTPIEEYEVVQQSY